jgi:hypothetical protein
VFVNRLCEAKGEQDAKADEAQESADVDAIVVTINSQNDTSEPTRKRPLLASHKRGYDGLKWSWLILFWCVIWEIILRDSWGAILRALLTRALNLCPIAVHKSSIRADHTKQKKSYAG